MTRNEWLLLSGRVINWAKQYRKDDLYYGTPFSYWNAARFQGIISEAEFAYAEKHYGKLWHYRGD